MRTDEDQVLEEAAEITGAMDTHTITTLASTLEVATLPGQGSPHMGQPSPRTLRKIKASVPGTLRTNLSLPSLLPPLGDPLTPEPRLISRAWLALVARHTETVCSHILRTCLSRVLSTFL